jgi:signal transduction histidine kinase
LQLIQSLRSRWKRLSLALQYGIAGGLVVACAMVLIGFWVTRVIEQGIKSNAASATALYVDSVIAPLLPELREDKPLDVGVRRALDEVLSQGTLGSRLKSFMIWRRDGKVVYALDHTIIGRKFPPSGALRQAWAGAVVAGFVEPSDIEGSRPHGKSLPFLEIYSPIREPWSGEVVAVAEFYEVASEIKSNLATARRDSWLVVAGLAAATMAILSGIVFGGSRTIQRQRQALTEQVGELSALLVQNRTLRQRVQRASRRASAINERYLRRIGADLHDGPAQLVALAALRIDSEALVSRTATATERRNEVAAIRSSLDEAMAEIRSICSGLVLPHIETADLARIVEVVIAAHEQRTGSRVMRPAKIAPAMLSAPEKICIFRFVQETLNNAYRHAAGKGQAVDVVLQDGRLTVAVFDAGPGFDPEAIDRTDGLGLAGLKERAESIGGQFDLRTSPAGTRASITLNVEEMERA